jgi:hypothetical protein
VAIAVAVAPWRGAAARAAGVAGSARAFEKGLEPGTDVGGVGIEGFGSFAGALEKGGVMNVSFVVCLRVEHVLRGGGGWLCASSAKGCGRGVYEQ